MPGDTDERLEALEVTLETVLRPLVDLVTPERVNAIERAGYESQLRIAALEMKLGTLEARVTQAEATATEALQTAKAILDSRIWQALVKSGDFILRVTGRSR